MKKRPWRRLLMALVLLSLAAAFLADGPEWRQILLSWQFTPALLAGGALFAVAVLTLASSILFGRVYCSVFCPAGIVQDIFSWLGAKCGLARGKFAPPAKAYLIILVPAAIMLALGVILPNLFEPAALFGRLASPVAEVVRDARHGTDSASSYLGLAGAALACSFLLLAVPAFLRGRWLCDRLCPVGATLGVAASASLCRLRVERKTCVDCGACEGKCPTRCLEPEKREIDFSRCVLCFACADACRPGAIVYGVAPSADRRRLLSGLGGWLAAGTYVAFRGWRRFLGPVTVGPDWVLPPGAGDADAFLRGCIGCQACASACPVGILRPRLPGMQPVLDFDAGYCQYNCDLCTRSCPTGALKPLGLEKKQRTRIAANRLLLERCVVVTQGTACGACAEVCPTHAVSMREETPGEPTRPVLDASLCVGCGACYHVCPAAPRAFALAGLNRHELAEPPYREEKTDKGTESESAEPAVPEGGLEEFPF